jgi:hypothetical protein
VSTHLDIIDQCNLYPNACFYDEMTTAGWYTPGYLD